MSKRDSSSRDQKETKEVFRARKRRGAKEPPCRTTEPTSPLIKHDLRANRDTESITLARREGGSRTKR